MLRSAFLLAWVTAAGTVLLGGPDPARTLAALALVLLLGHGVATRLLAFQSGDVLGRLVVSWALGLPVAGMVLLGFYHLHLAASSRLYAAVLAGLGAVLPLLPARLRLDLPWPRPLAGRLPAAALAALIVAATLRLSGLGYADFQRDEVLGAVEPALSMLRGAEGVLESARRPPLQAVVPAATRHLGGELAENLVRWPFALSSLTAVYLAGVLGARVFGPSAGVLAMLLLALDGLQVALGRIAQYQALVSMLVLLAACALWEAWRDPARGRAWAAVGCLAWGLATAAHYEALLLAPLALGTVVLAARSPGGGTPLPRSWVAACAAAGLLPLALAYVPLVASPAFSGHLAYYSSTRYDDLPNFNLPAMLETGWLYLSWTHLLLLIAGLAALRGAGGPSPPSPLRFLLWWTLPGALVFLVLTSDPGTHVYTLYLPWTVAAAGGLARFPALAGRQTRLLGRRLTFPSEATCRVLLGLLLVLGAGNVYASLLRRDPEYPWVLAAVERPRVKLFGFPYHRGWRTAGWLFRSGALAGPYATNEKTEISRYYLRQRAVDAGRARYLLRVHDPQSWTKEWPLPDACPVVVRILSLGRPAIDVCERDAAPGPVRVLEATASDRAYATLDRAPR